MKNKMKAAAKKKLWCVRIGRETAFVTADSAVEAAKEASDNPFGVDLEEALAEVSVIVFEVPCKVYEIEATKPVQPKFYEKEISWDTLRE